MLFDVQIFRHKFDVLFDVLGTLGTRPFFFQGQRMWPLARKSADPGEACGAILKGVLGGKTLVAIHGKQYYRGTGRGG